METKVPELPRKTPVVVLTNSDYKRPASILPTRTEPANPLHRNWSGTLFLSLHFFLALLLILVALFNFGYNSVSVINRIVLSVEGIPVLVAFPLAAVTLAALIAALVVPTRLLFGSDSTFKQLYLKKHLILFWSSIIIIICGLTCIGIHLYLYYKDTTKSHLTSYLPAGTFLLLNGLLNVKLYFELLANLDDDDEEEIVSVEEVGSRTLMLPFIPERVNINADLEMMNVSDRSSRSGVHYDHPNYNSNV